MVANARTDTCSIQSNLCWNCSNNSCFIRSPVLVSGFDDHKVVRKVLTIGMTLLPVRYDSPDIIFVAFSNGFKSATNSLTVCSSDAVNISGAVGHCKSIELTRSDSSINLASMSCVEFQRVSTD
ncbi:hypothetical protein KPH14_008162 [Odynerus spinipes]|uniref:Uncharacterized protein n=1 Tax=Odynerus spinipes TaxID=1348599 RepID=A0AAD9VI20_9HYME|nr:hypothetical protein KPH14_008162 [Odynerus spinipes]